MKILIVDDEKDVEMLFRQKFRKEIKRGEVEMVFAFSGQEALEVLSKEQPPDQSKSRRSISWLTVLLLLAISLFIGYQVGTTSATLLAPPAPTSTPTPRPVISTRPVIEKIQHLSRLETIQYTMRDVVSIEREGGFLGFGGEKILLIVRGSVVAGVDLSAIEEDDIRVSDDEITLHLPPVEIFSHSLDQESIEIYDYQKDIFTRPDEKLIPEAMKAGQQQVLKAACDDGIMREATDNAQRSMEILLQSLQFERVTVETAPIPECPDNTSLAPSVTPSPAPSTTPDT